jgi:hypothetical protein
MPNCSSFLKFTGKVALDMVSLFPQKTFKNRKNGLRADLAQTIADLHPRLFVSPEAVCRMATASTIFSDGKIPSVPWKPAKETVILELPPVDGVGLF